MLTVKKKLIISNNDKKDTNASTIDLKVSHEDFIGKRSGKITSEYKLLQPPLGKGRFFIFNIILFLFRRFWRSLQSYS